MLLCVLSGIITGLTFVFKDLCFLNLLSLIPFIISVSEGNRSFLKGMLYTASLNAVTMSFFFRMHPMEFMGLSGFKSLLVIFLMYLGVIILEGVIGGLFVYLFNRFIKNIWLFPLFYCFFEMVTGFGEFGLTFSHLYLCWYKNLWFIQSASVLGCYFLTLIIVTSNLLIYKYFKLKKLKYILIFVVVFSLNIGFGAIRVNLLNEGKFNFDLALIQGNISSTEKWQGNGNEESFKIYEKLTREVKDKYDVDGVIWPETVINSEIFKGSFWYEKISSLSKELEFDILSGCFLRQGDYYYNSLFAFNNGVQYEDVYRKRHLIPFAENEYSKEQRLKEGKTATVLNTRLGNIGGLICIDSAYPYLAGDLGKKDIDYFVVVTNDSWFSDSFGVESHFAHSVFRAVENNRYLLRTGNTGITAVISPLGKVQGKLEPMTRGYTVIKGGKVTNEKK